MSEVKMCWVCFQPLWGAVHNCPAANQKRVHAANPNPHGAANPTPLGPFLLTCINKDCLHCNPKYTPPPHDPANPELERELKRLRYEAYDRTRGGDGLGRLGEEDEKVLIDFITQREQAAYERGWRDRINATPEKGKPDGA